VLLVISDAKATGPMLRGISAKHDMPWLYKWIHSSALIKSGDAAAVKVYEENNKVAMTVPALSDADIDDIIAYTQSQKRKPSCRGWYRCCWWCSRRRRF
jgi:hypothetical protein